jgi:hypothetical protein
MLPFLRIYQYVAISKNKALTNLSFPKLTVTSYGNEFSIDNNPALASIAFPALVNSSGYFEIDENNTLTSISFPVLTTLSEGIRINSNSKLTSIGFPSLISISVGGYYSLQNNALPSSQINSILNKLVTVTPLTGISISLHNQTPPAPPTGQGITDKATLINNGNNVATD